MPRKRKVVDISKSRTRWNQARRVARIPAEVAKRNLDRIAAQHGGNLQAAYVLKDARNPKSELHPAFDWDDGVAAERWRLSQAAEMIRAVVVVLDDDSEYSAYVSVVHGKRRMYISTPRAMADDDLRASLLQEALEYVRMFRQRFNRLREMAPVLAAIDKVISKRIGKRAA